MQMGLMEQMTEDVYERLAGAGRTKLAEMYRMCFRNTWDTTLQLSEGTAFLITGDIPAMWLRDSSAQVFHYLPYARHYPEIMETVERLLKRQFQYIILDPYANAFNREADGAHGCKDHTSWTPEAEPWIWERKYEVDSLCYPIRLAHTYWKETGSTAWCDQLFQQAAQTILSVWTTEQHHMEQSPYYFERGDCPPSDTLVRDGRGTEVGYTGMTWSGFRPSDDACRYGYLIPSNFFAARSLEMLSELAHVLLRDEQMVQICTRMRREILEGIARYGILHHPEFGEVYAYEVDGLGHAHFMDDANVPSLLSLPYLGCIGTEDNVYRNTRRMILSPENPYYYEGRSARGIGSPHTPKDYIWPISLCIQGLSTDDREEAEGLLDMLENMDAGTHLMHEGVHKDDPKKYTRPWFAWANSIFSEFVERVVRW